MTLNNQRHAHRDSLQDAYEKEDKLRELFNVQEIEFEQKFKIELAGERTYENGKIGWAIEKTRVAVTLVFSETASATFFRRNIIEKNHLAFRRVRQRGTQLEFDLTENLVGTIFDISCDSLDEYSNNTIHWGLIEKYGGRETLIHYLWDRADEDGIIDVTVL